MKAVAFVLLAVLCASRLEARHLGFGVDAFNRVVPATATGARAFSPVSFEIDCVLFAEAVDPIRRALFAHALRVMDDFESEYRTLAHLPFESSATNGLGTVWAQMLAVGDVRGVDPAYRLLIQDLYGAEICGRHSTRGAEAWVRARFAGAFDGWRLPRAAAGANAYSLYDLVSVTAEAVPTNGWMKAYPTHTLYRQPLAGGLDLYALAPSAGRSVSSLRARLTSVTLGEILAASADLSNPPKRVRLALPAADFTSTNELAGAFSYFRFPTSALKPLPPGARPNHLRQTVRCRFRPSPSDPGAVPLEGPFLFFIHDPEVQAIPVMGIVPDRR